MKSDHQIIRDYVTGADHLQYQGLPDGIVCCLVTHSNLDANHLDIRLDLHMSVSLRQVSILYYRISRNIPIFID